VIDASYFIKLKEFNSQDVSKYITTEFIIQEIKDEQSKKHYELNKQFVEIKNPKRENIKLISAFAKESNDLKTLSIPDISIIALAYELIQNEGKEECLRKHPTEYNIIDRIKEKQTEFEVKEKKEEIVADEEGFMEVKSKGKKKKKEMIEKDEDEGEWITSENINDKLVLESKTNEEEANKNKQAQINTVLITSDFTLQNVALKIGIPIKGINNLEITKLRYYILKCYSCNTFIFDTDKMFCPECGYNTLMKIGYSVNSKGKVKIYDKKTRNKNSRNTV